MIDMNSEKIEMIPAMIDMNSEKIDMYIYKDRDEHRKDGYVHRKDRYVFPHMSP